ncbi:uncharacterized protein LOC111869699 [Cryptotermes secundus]|nr:uncharacterized protein LOC111869699 [Cryptotermes secundus]
MGFKWKKTRNNRGALIERDIRSKRVAYLCAIKKYREEGQTIIYEDETFIHSSHTRPKNWTDDTPSGYMAPVSKGQRLIIVYAGGRTGFIPGSLLIFKSHLKTGDYHSEMNVTNYQKWLTEKLIPNLPPKSVLVVDNAPYHTMQFNKAPTSQTMKAKMMEWLTVNKVPFHDRMLKIQLYDLIKTHKPLHKNFVMDNIMVAYGHTVLRLPPYHPDLNPIELVWADVKQSVGAENVSFHLDDVAKICEKWFSGFGTENWGKVCDRTKKNEKEYIKKEGIRENTIERIIIRRSEDSSDSDSSDNDTTELSENSDLSGVELLDE